jgi:hypothetical protein
MVKKRKSIEKKERRTHQIAKNAKIKKDDPVARAEGESRRAGAGAGEERREKRETEQGPT